MKNKEKAIKQLEKQKEEIEKQIEELKNKNIWRRFKCLPNIEISQIQEWNEQYSDIEIPKGCRLIEAWEWCKLVESNEADKFLGKYKGKYSCFWLKQNKYSKERNYSFRAVLVGDSGWGVDNGNPENSNEDGRVVFVRDLGDKK